jgi:hypothetical protein
MPLTRVNWFRAGLSNHCTTDQSEIANSGRRLRSPVDAFPIGWDASFDVTPISGLFDIPVGSRAVDTCQFGLRVRGHQSPVQSGGNGNRKSPAATPQSVACAETSQTHPVGRMELGTITGRSTIGNRRP